MSTNWKDESYDFIIVILDQLIKIVSYKLIKVLINASKLTKVIFNILI